MSEVIKFSMNFYGEKRVFDLKRPNTASDIKRREYDLIHWSESREILRNEIISMSEGEKAFHLAAKKSNVDDNIIYHIILATVAPLSEKLRDFDDFAQQYYIGTYHFHYDLPIHAEGIRILTILVFFFIYSLS